MNLRPIAANQTEVSFPNGTEVFFSYKTPVAGYDSLTGQFFRTRVKYSVTTTRHINKWLDGRVAQEVDQKIIDNLVGG
tara:strand:- start:6 stop:239 length:234 start_codon:yes stop_codon:yes gene_type:complete